MELLGIISRAVFKWPNNFCEPFEGDSALKNFIYRVYSIFLKYLVCCTLLVEFIHSMEEDLDNVTRTFDRLYHLLAETTRSGVSKIFETGKVVVTTALILKDKYIYIRILIAIYILSRIPLKQQ